MATEKIKMNQVAEDNSSECVTHQPLLDDTYKFTEDEHLRQVFKYGTAIQVQELLSKIDPNVQFHKSRPIHLAAESGNVHAVTSLLEDSRTIVQHVNGYNRTALHLAAKEGNHEVLKLLLENNRGRDIDINAVDKQGRTALHLAAEMPVSGDGTEERFLRCLMLLMSRSDLEVNKPDSFGRTAISRALRKSHKSRVQVILKHLGEHKLNLDYCLVDGGQTVRENILEKIPEFMSFLPDPLMEDMNSSQPKIRLLAALQHGNLEEFTDILHKNKGLINNQYKEPYYCTCLELSCVIKGREKFAQVILDLNCDPNIRNYISGIPLLHMAAERLNLPALEVLLSTKGININVKGLNNGTLLHWMALNKCVGDEASMSQDRSVSLLMRSTKDKININAKDSRGDTPLHVAVRWGNLNLALNLLASGASVDVWNNKHYTPLHVAALSGSKDAVLTLRKYGADIDAQDGRGTPLHVAAQMGKKEIVLLLLKQGANFMCETRGEPPLRYIESQTLETFFDECIQSSGMSPKTPDYMLTFKYNFIPELSRVSNVPIFDTVMGPLLKMSEMSELRYLLKHPLISSILFLKWRYVCLAVYLHIALYVLFVITLTLHVLFLNTSVAFQRHNREGVVSCQSFEHPLNIMLWIFLLLITLREIVQFVIDWHEYLTNGRNIIDVSIIFSVLIVNYNCSLQVSRHAASIAILLVWIESLLLIGRLPSVSVELEMFKKVCRTFLKFGSCYSPLIIAFSLSFNIMFEGEHNIVENLAMANDSGEIVNRTLNILLFLFQSFIMFTGEFDARDLNFSYTPGTSHLVFFLFVSLVALTMLNLLNGLAVNDTQAIIDDAETLSLVARLKLVLQMEGIVSYCQRHMYNINCLKRFCFSFSDLPNKRLFIYPSRKREAVIRPGGKVIGKMEAGIINRAIDIAMRKGSKSQQNTGKGGTNIGGNGKWPTHQPV